MKILFIRLGAIGDVIQAAAALRIYKDMHPETSIDWVVDSAYADLVKSFKVADKIISVNSKAIIKGNLYSRFIGLIQAQLNLGLKQHYDVAITAHPDWRYNLLSLFISTKKRLSPVNLDPIGRFVVTENRTLEHLRLLNKIHPAAPHDKISKDLLDQAIASLGNALLSNYISAFGSEIDKKLPSEYVALVPGGAKNTLRDDPLRRWPINWYVELARLLIASGKNVLLLGGPDDRWVNEYFDGLSVENLIGKTNLLDMVCLLNNARVTVCHDSGPLHLASITKTPLISIFGPTPPSAVISDTRANTAILNPTKEVSCSPCYDGKNYAVCKNNICMQNSPVNFVLEKLNILFPLSTKVIE